jgi:four helix bundle protein
VSKLEGALQELEESLLWLELLVEGDVLSAQRVQSLQDETNELMSMFVTMTKNVKRQNRT